ncbi:MAG: sugar ABC transporter ATP-binding protein [Flaviflexus sp.]|nr:sugar ABC transporter ATP-binding protein [Flaviflexus sp.]
MTKQAQASAAREDFLRVEGIDKGFGGVPVLEGISLEIEQGTVVALAGENGAGKSTLMKIISGQYEADAGKVFVDGEQLTGGIHDALERGVAIVPQELAGINDMMVYENLFVGREIKNKLGFLDRGEMIRQAQQMIDEFGVNIRPEAQLRSLSVALRQIVEIIKNSSRGARVLLLDEPTSAISERETEKLYDVVRRLRDQGVAMMYTTHKMAEIRAIADRVVVLRDGHLVDDRLIDEITDEEIVTSMIGRELEALFPPVTEPESEECVFEAEDMVVDGASGPVSLKVRRGEIVSLSGLVGAGRTEFLEAVFGKRKILAGKMRVGDREFTKTTPVESIASHIAMVPEDRKGEGLFLQMNVGDNGAIPRIERYHKAGWLLRSKQAREVGDVMKSVRLKSKGLRQSVGTLSGGNQQKIVVARWLTGRTDLLLLDEPTRGVDVGARSELYHLIVDLAKKGMGILLVSSDINEVLGLSNRTLVMRDGVIQAELNREELVSPDAQEVIFLAASGQGVAERPDARDKVPDKKGKP